MNKSILLIIGITISLLFVFFSTPIYESIYYDRAFSNEMYNQSVYFPIALSTALCAWGICGVYYYVINSVSFSRWYHWGIMLILSCVLSASISFFYIGHIFDSYGLIFDTQIINFSLRNIFVALVLTLIATYSVRWWSTNCRHTPIPE